MHGNLKYRMYEQYECVKEQRINEQMWENNNQCSKLLDNLENSQDLGKLAIVEALYFLDLEKFLIFLDLEIF